MMYNGLSDSDRFNPSLAQYNLMTLMDKMFLCLKKELLILSTAIYRIIILDIVIKSRNTKIFLIINYLFRVVV